MSNDIYKSRYSGQEQEVLFNKINNLDVSSLGGSEIYTYLIQGKSTDYEVGVVFKSAKKYEVNEKVDINEIFYGFDHRIADTDNPSAVSLINSKPALIHSYVGDGLPYLTFSSTWDDMGEIIESNIEFGSITTKYRQFYITRIF